MSQDNAKTGDWVNPLLALQEIVMEETQTQYQAKMLMEQIRKNQSSKCFYVWGTLDPANLLILHQKGYQTDVNVATWSSENEWIRSETRLRTKVWW
jgi:hypothetical protein